MNHIHRIRRLGLVLSPMLLLAAGAAGAQDSFGQSRGQQYPQQQQQYPQQPQQYSQPPQQYPPQPQQYRPQPQQAPYSDQPYSNQSAMPAPMASASSEGQDFGVAPTSQLRPTQQLHGPTPTSIPGGRVIATQQLVQLLQGGQPVVLLDVLGGPQLIPGAVPVVPAAQGGGFSDEVQQGYGQYLAQVTGGDTSRLLVTYCGGVQCWSSYNAALRAMKLGYRNVAWYRGGIEAWQQAGLPLQGAGGPAAQPQQPPSGQRQW